MENAIDPAGGHGQALHPPPPLHAMRPPRPHLERVRRGIENSDPLRDAQHDPKSIPAGSTPQIMLNLCAGPAI
jgi:hypothetical protein